ncbi:anthrone oxygenase family protein [Nonomuraea sp. NPDC050691]|uniref:anthrone oxygenase family protein n=1 Tax=Nonomuraea sp. NPDC050691 TaxID=3155661 RepID=UPI0033F35C13
MSTAFAIISLLFNGLMAGLFYTFSTTVMPAFNAIEPAQATAAMRSINKKILNPLFLPVFLLAPVASLVTGVLLLVDGAATAGVLFLAAGAVYLLGTLGATSALNVPMNNALEAGSMDWSAYAPRWTTWNHVRSLSCVAALVLAGVALVLV